jgi:hypothetical protein
MKHLHAPCPWIWCWNRCAWALCLGLWFCLLANSPTWAQTERSAVQPAGTAGNLLYHPYLPNDPEGERTIVEVLNLTSAAVVFTATFYDAGGSQVEVLDGELAPDELLPIDVARLPGVADGDHSLIITATASIATLVRVKTPLRAGATVGGAGLYQGMAHGCGDAAFGPFYGGDHASQLALANPGVQGVDVQLSFFASSGSLVLTTTVAIAPQGMTLVSPADELPANFVGLATMRTNWPVVGLLVQRHTRDGIEFVPGQVAYTLAAQQSSPPALHYPAPRLLAAADLGGGARSTTLFVGATGAGVTEVQLDSFTASGTPLGSIQPHQLASRQSRFYQATAWAGALQSARVSGSQPLYVVEQTDFQQASPYASATYGQADPASCANWLRIPYVAAQESRYSIFYVHNVDLDAAPVAITYRDRAGVAVATTHYELEAGGVHAFDLRLVAELPTGFEGSAEILTPVRLLCTLIDEYGVGYWENTLVGNLQQQLHLPAVFTP